MTNTLGFLTPKIMTVLEFFLEDLMHEYHKREVIRKMGVSVGSANKTLRMLAKMDFLTRKEKGRLAIYRLNQKEAH
ncbi:MAG: hypothetical protein WDA42_08895 [Candidatus Bathyarchaeia archaeon]